MLSQIDRKNEKIRISAIVHAYNEEKNIKDCLESLKWCNEIVIIDMHSNDKTIEIAKNCTDKIYYFEPCEYADPARNYGLNKTGGDWILILDADERIPDKLVNVLKNVACQNKYDVVYMPWKNIIFNKWIKHTQWWPDYHPRFFRKGFVEYTNEIHNMEKTFGRKLYLDAKPENAVIHYNYQNISHFIQKLNRYTSIEAAKLNEKGIKFNIIKLFGKPIKEFIWRYILGKGFLDGIHGLILSCLMSFYWFAVYLKLWEISKK